MVIRDRSSESFPGSIQQHGHGHLATNDSAAVDPGVITGEGMNQGRPHVPAYHAGTEVSAIEGDLEPCVASAVDDGGTIYQGDLVGKCIDKCGPTMKTKGPTGSIRHFDGTGGSGQEESSAGGSTMPMQKPVTANPNQKAHSGSGLTVTLGNGGPARGPAIANPTGTRFGSV
jgi:hypothetical protein